MTYAHGQEVSCDIRRMRRGFTYLVLFKVNYNNNNNNNNNNKIYFQSKQINMQIYIMLITRSVMIYLKKVKKSLDR